MTRSHAREIAVHMIFALSFGDFDAEELLAQQMNHERFEELAPDMPLYSQYPNEKQEKYIYALVRGVFGHGYELDDYIARYAKNWNFARIPRMAAAIMRTAMLSPPPQGPSQAWKESRGTRYARRYPARR